MDEWQGIRAHLVAIAGGDHDAWAELLVELAPKLSALARRQPIGRLREDEDARHDIVLRVIAKLHNNEFAAITKFVEHDDPPPLSAWVRVLVKSAAIDTMRGQHDFVRAGKDREARWLSLATLVTRPGAAEPSLVGKRREVISFLSAAVDEARTARDEHADGAAAELAARWQIAVRHARRLLKRLEVVETLLSMVLAGHSHREVADAVELSEREVNLCVVYIEEFFVARGFAS